MAYYIDKDYEWTNCKMINPLNRQEPNILVQLNTYCNDFYSQYKYYWI